MSDVRESALSGETDGREPAMTGAAGRRKPAWLRVKPPAPATFRSTGALVEELGLHTVCGEARCPNKGECFAAGTATFLILGDACTRSCGFCAVGRAPAAAGGRAVSLGCPDADEPRRVAQAAHRLDLRHVVITGVTRDDLPDGGAGAFAATVEAVREALPTATIEVLVSDLNGEAAALECVLAAAPDVLNHNLETVPRLYPDVRPQAGYSRSLELLGRAAAWARGATHRGDNREGPPAAPQAHRPLVKTGLMVGLGESGAEVLEVLRDCADTGVDAVTVGQYLQPTRANLPVARYVPPEEFADLERRGSELGLLVIAGPFVRSSYRAGEVLSAAPARYEPSE